MQSTNRRGFLRALGALSAGLLVEPLVEPIIVVPERKIWVVGAQLQSSSRDEIFTLSLSEQRQGIIAEYIRRERLKLEPTGLPAFVGRAPLREDIAIMQALFRALVTS